MRDLKDLKFQWEGHAQTDPLWAILSDPSRQQGRWDTKEFFATGESEIKRMLEYLKAKGLWPDFGAKALDFGCGVGRLTQALGTRFAGAVGVDISAVMVEEAKKYNTLGDKCQYFVNDTDALAAFKDGSFGLVYASIVLQHIHPRYGLNYLREFVRVLKPNGLAVFQVPDKKKIPILKELRARLRLRNRLNQALAFLRLPHGAFYPYAVDMNLYPEAMVRGLFKDLPVDILDAAFTNSTQQAFNGNLEYLPVEPDDWYVSKQYVVRKK